MADLFGVMLNRCFHFGWNSEPPHRSEHGVERRIHFLGPGPMIMPTGIVTVPTCCQVTPSLVVDTLTRASLSTIIQSDDESITVAFFVAQPLIASSVKLVANVFRSVCIFHHFRFLGLLLSPV